MIDYRAGDWGFHVAFGLRGSLVPRGLAVAIPNAIITAIVGTFLVEEPAEFGEDRSKTAQLCLGAATTIMVFILYNRSRTSYARWWEGGTLLQKARGEWFNSYSSMVAFMSTKPELQEQVNAYAHLIARLMSLLMCCALQQVSPNRARPFEILGLEGIEPTSMDFLNTAPDKVEILLQWIQRSMVLQTQTGVLPVAPPILSRAFQEVSRGIVNLQNARKIADFPYPYPLAQLSMLLQMIHWIAFPFAASMAVTRIWAVALSFVSIFVLWCIHFNALDLEFPFGTRVNDLPMNEFQQDWNKSLCTLLDKRASRPPKFTYEPHLHDDLAVAMSDASALFIPTSQSILSENRCTISRIEIDKRAREHPGAKRYSQRSNELPVEEQLAQQDSRVANSLTVASTDPGEKPYQRFASSEVAAAGTGLAAVPPSRQQTPEPAQVKESDVKEQRQGQSADNDIPAKAEDVKINASSSDPRTIDIREGADSGGRPVGTEALAQPVGIGPLVLNSAATAATTQDIEEPKRVNI